MAPTSRIVMMPTSATGLRRVLGCTAAPRVVYLRFALCSQCGYPFASRLGGAQRAHGTPVTRTLHVHPEGATTDNTRLPVVVAEVMVGAPDAAVSLTTGVEPGLVPTR